MSDGLLLEEIRVGLQYAVATLEAQTVAMAQALLGRLPPAERRWLRRVADQLAQRIATWQEFASDEPELVTRLKMIAQRVHKLQTGRRQSRSACSRDRSRCATRQRSGEEPNG